MYESYYGFTNTPFSRSISTKDLYEHQDFVEVKHRLKYAMEKRTFAVITGPVGAGKTTVLRCIRDELNANIYTYIYISQSTLTPKIFYNEILKQLHIKTVYSKPEAKMMVNKTVMSMYNSNKVPVIVIDEAHLLSDAMLEEIRFLINFDMDSMSPLSLILVGQTELKYRLKLKTLEAISQRIMINYHLEGLNRSDTEDYILTHLKVAGLGTPLFTDEAINEIYQYTEGIPRKINILCEKCLLEGYIQEKKLIDDILVKRVIKNECE